jgi:hypothetical protein
LGIAWRLVGRGSEIPVPQSASSARQQEYLLSVGGDVADVFACFSVIYDGSAGHFNITVFPVFTRTSFRASALSGGGDDMSFIFQVEQGPVVTVSSEIDTTSFTAVASVRATFGYVLLPAEMGGASPPLSRTAINFYVIYKV